MTTFRVRPVARVRLSGLVLAALTAGCGGARQSGIETHVDTRSADLVGELHSGFAFAPTLVTGSRRDAGPVGAELSRELYGQLCTDLLLSAVDAPVRSPEQVRAATPAGPPAEALASLQRRRAAGEPLDPHNARSVASAIGTSRLLVTWLAERDERGAQILLTELEGVPWPPDGGTVPYTRVHGELWGELVDLEGARVLWRGVSVYRTERGTAAAVRSQLPQFRARAAAALSRLLLAP